MAGTTREITFKTRSLQHTCLHIYQYKTLKISWSIYDAFPQLRHDQTPRGPTDTLSFTYSLAITDLRDIIPDYSILTTVNEHTLHKEGNNYQLTQSNQAHKIPNYQKLQNCEHYLKIGNLPWDPGNLD